MTISEDGELNRGGIIITVHHLYTTPFGSKLYFDDN